MRVTGSDLAHRHRTVKTSTITVLLRAFVSTQCPCAHTCLPTCCGQSGPLNRAPDLLNGYSRTDDQSNDDAEEDRGRDQQIIQRHCSVVFGPRREGTRLGERPAVIDSDELITVE